MMTDQQIEQLTTAGETIYQYCDKENGFYSGTSTDADNGRVYTLWNNFTGAKAILERHMNRTLTKAEITILSLAIGFGPTPCLDGDTRKNAMDSLWRRQCPDQQPGSYRPLMAVLTSFY